MTNREIIKILTMMKGAWMIVNATPKDREAAALGVKALDAAISALKGPTREQVEKMRGEWIIEDAGDGDRRKKCSLCDRPISGWWGRDRFCANCGAPMTNEAVDMMMERLEALKDGSTTD